MADQAIEDFKFLTVEELMRIELSAARKATLDNPAFSGRLIDIITDEHIKHGIRQTYAEFDGFSEDLVGDLLECYRNSKRVQDSVSILFDNLLTDSFTRH